MNNRPADLNQAFQKDKSEKPDFVSSNIFDLSRFSYDFEINQIFEKIKEIQIRKN
ncbi:hypothetical protein [Methanolapillus ohkumae]|uniref:Uncharacterized protein n=1 Tax=Methanolapillus ohkumae TaxID=3028298 RepID=A0AA96ZW01_9EURY|nr:hypothetical protein MsAm2_12520 [Methanosarcinaceae archaeon Am2]